MKAIACGCAVLSGSRQVCRVLALGLLVIVELGFGDSRANGDEPSDAYDSLYNVIMVRKDSVGNAYGLNEVGPLIFGRSEFPFDDRTYPKLATELKRFSLLSDDQIKSCGTVKRALLQRHLWTLFDATFPNDYKPPSHVERRVESREMLARLIRRLALTKGEIKSLPDTQVSTIKAGMFSTEFDPSNPFKPFLPADIGSKGSDWICLGKKNYFDSDHARIDRWRSVFFQFVRLPTGRRTTLEYVKKLNDRIEFPIGTQFALVEQAFLIDEKGEMILSPLVNSIQLRAYLNVEKTALQIRPKPVVCVAEFVIQPKELMKGNPVMKALGPDEVRYQTTASGSGGLVDPFADSSPASIRSRVPTLRSCVNCHERSRAGVRSLGDFMFGERAVDRLTFEAGIQVDIAKGVTALKRKNETWQKLRRLWQSND